MRAALLALLAVLVVAGEAPPKLTQAEQDAIWQEAMRKSQQAQQPAPAPVRVSPSDPRNTPEYKAAEAAERQRQADEQRRKEEAAAAEALRRREAEQRAEEQRAEDERKAWRQREQERLDQQANAEREARAAEQAKRDLEEQQARKKLILGIVSLVIGLFVAVLPSIIAWARRIPQRGPVAALVVLSIVAALGTSNLPALAGAAAILWAGAWVLAVWRYQG